MKARVRAVQNESRLTADKQKSMAGATRAANTSSNPARPMNSATYTLGTAILIPSHFKA
jgi:hypothetical protein